MHAVYDADGVLLATKACPMTITAAPIVVWEEVCTAVPASRQIGLTSSVEFRMPQIISGLDRRRNLDDDRLEDEDDEYESPHAVWLLNPS